MGAEVIAPMAVPVLGGLLISDEIVDIFLPVRFYWVRFNGCRSCTFRDLPLMLGCSRAARY